jgi:hypothetical protein
MAAPVLLVTAVAPITNIGDKKYVDAILSYDTGNYVTGGAPIAASDFGLTRLDGIAVLGASVHGAEYDQVAGKMILRVRTTNAEVGSGVALTTGSAIRVRAVGA